MQAEQRTRLGYPPQDKLIVTVVCIYIIFISRTIEMTREETSQWQILVFFLIFFFGGGLSICGQRPPASSNTTLGRFVLLLLFLILSFDYYYP